MDSNDCYYVHDEAATIIWNLGMDEKLLKQMIKEGAKQALQCVCEISSNQEAKEIANNALDTVFSHEKKKKRSFQQMPYYDIVQLGSSKYCEKDS